MCSGQHVGFFMQTGSSLAYVLDVFTLIPTLQAATVHGAARAANELAVTGLTDTQDVL
jgi:hypothetical protein